MIKLTKKEKERLKGHTYKQKLQYLFRKYNKTTDLQSYITSVYKRWGVTQISRRQIRRLTKKEQTAYYRREYKILQGKYDIERKRQWKANYKQAMENAGVDKELIDEFVKVTNINNIDLLSRDLSDITSWYIQNANIQTAKDDADKMVKTIIGQARKGRYKESRELYKVRMQEQVRDTATTLSMYKQNRRRGRKR